jgi:hypothetical protein
LKATQIVLKTNIGVHKKNCYELAIDLLRETYAITFGQSGQRYSVIIG